MKQILTVVIPAYDDIEHLDRMLHSLEEATNNNIAKILIIDDYSSLTESDYNECISKHNLEIKFLKNTKNIGVGATREKGWSLCDTEWISFVDQDDYVMQNYFDRFIEAYKNNTNKMMFVFTKKHITNEDECILYSSCIHFGGNFYHRNILKKYDMKMSKNRMSDDIFLNGILGSVLFPVYDFAEIFDDDNYIYTWDHTNKKSQTLSNSQETVESFILEAKEESKLFLEKYIKKHPEVEEYWKKQCQRVIDSDEELSKKNYSVPKNKSWCVYYFEKQIEESRQKLALLQLTDEERKTLRKVLEVRIQTYEKVKEKLKYLDLEEHIWMELVDIQICIEIYIETKNNEDWKAFWKYIRGKENSDTIQKMQSYCDKLRNENAMKAIEQGDYSYILDLNFVNLGMHFLSLLFGRRKK